VTRIIIRHAIAMGAALTLVAAAPQRASPQTADVDRIFAKWTASTPGCAVGAAVDGRPVLEKAYGLADLEHDVRNTQDTLFEAGSVSKQFTAAAVLLLARDGKLSLDDPVRTYLPEVPDYGAPLTIRHILTHTSGLRDWGNIEAIAGWPRTTRAYTQAHVLDIVSRQHALNFTPGTHWSYSNTGYNLAAMIVTRVSGGSFASFTRQRIFEPLGMTHSSWRDDHTRVVKGRAIAYAETRDDGFHTEMPFEDVYGNSSLLTTVGDLLKWNEHFDAPPSGDEALVKEQQQPGHFADGRVHHYALGLEVGAYKGVRQIDHSGSTAGYRAHLARYPADHVSIAVLCNVSSGQATQYAHAVADLYLADRLKPPPAPAPAHTLTDAELDRAAGLYRHTVTGVPLTVARDKATLRAGRGSMLVPMTASRLVTAAGQTWEFDGRGGLRVRDEFGSTDDYVRMDAAKPTAQDLRAFTGAYTSAEAETTITAAIDGDSLVLKRRPDTVIKLTPTDPDAFSAGAFGTVIFIRDGSGRPIGFHVSQDRVWDLRFTREDESKR
jgi:CubicO group peptidase (beta-lactamase class C family)